MIHLNRYRKIELHRVLLFFFFCLQVDNLISQVTHSVSLGPDLGLPAKSFGSESTLGIGGSWNYQAKFKGPIGFQIHAGYIHFSNKVLSDDKVDFIPIRFGPVAYIYKDVFFIFADVGVSHFSASTGTKQTGFSFGLGPGYNIYIGPESKHFLQFSAYYNLHNYKHESGGNSYNYNYTWFNIRAAYGFSFSRKPIAK